MEEDLRIAADRDRALPDDAVLRAAPGDMRRLGVVNRARELRHRAGAAVHVERGEEDLPSTRATVAPDEPVTRITRCQGGLLRVRRVVGHPAIGQERQPVGVEKIEVDLRVAVAAVAGSMPPPASRSSNCWSSS